MHSIIGFNIFSFNPSGLLPIIAAALAVVLFWWAVIDAIASQRIKGSEKLLWVLAIFFIPCVGPLLYLFLGRKRAEV